MPSITISAPSVVATEEDLLLELFVDSAAWVGFFDSLEVWRSRTTAQGPFDPLMGDGWQVAALPRGAPPPPAVPLTGPLVTIVGTELELLVNEETALTVTFTGTDPLTYAQVVAQIISQGESLINAYVAVAQSSLIVLTTVQAGALASLRVTGGDAAAILGFSTTDPSNIAFGFDARIALKPGVAAYQYVDHSGSPDFFYKTRFFNSVSRTTSAFSPAFSGATVSSLQPANLVRGTVDLVDAGGVALTNRAVLLYPKFSGARVEGKTLVDGGAEVLTDVNGHAEFVLVRGQPFTVAIAGTDIARDFTTPTDPTVDTFDMLDPAISANDVFNVQEPNLDYATRRSL
jgi:hypothetical protein